jgi:hypothetical protein
MKQELQKVSSEAASHRAKLRQLKGELSRAWDLPGNDHDKHASERMLALHAVHEKWLKQGTTSHSEDTALVCTMQRQVIVTELKADLAEYRAERSRSVAALSVSRKVKENKDLLNENSALRRDKEGLEHELGALRDPTNACGQESARQVHNVALGEAQPIVLNKTEVQRKIGDSTGSECDKFVGAASVLGTPAAPSRPVSGPSTRVRSRPASASMLHTCEHLSMRPLSATALNSTRRASSARSSVQARQVSHIGQPPHATSSGAILGPSGRIVRYQPAQALHAIFDRERNLSSALQAEIETRDRLLEDQHAQMHILKAMVQRQILEESDLEGLDGADEVVYEAGAVDLEPSTVSASLGGSRLEADQSQPSLRAQSAIEKRIVGRIASAGEAIRRQTRPTSAQWRKQGASAHWIKRRPTSAGGVHVEAARSALRNAGKESRLAEQVHLV